MGFLNLFRRSPSPAATGASAAAARERLKVVLAHERTERAQPDYLPRMRRDILDVIARYVAIDEDRVRVQYQNSGTRSRLELDVELPPPAGRSAAMPEDDRGFDGSPSAAAVSRG